MSRVGSSSKHDYHITKELNPRKFAPEATPALKSEPDLFRVALGGADPAAYIKPRELVKQGEENVYADRGF
ncbi:hypothetical protein AGMMS49579_26270 [Spirochaetia bacterium]|nr:hypothetical protein AGMMS49579_26270 [Spirochaetia bacterium]